MPYKQPPIETRFPVNRKDHTKKGSYFKPAFMKLLKQKYPMQLPNGELVKMQGYPGIALAVIWEALRGDVAAAREVMDRVDGKVTQKTEGGSLEPIETLLVELIKKHRDNGDGFRITRVGHSALDKCIQK